MAEFNLWLLIIGIAAGAAVMWLVIGTLARQDEEVDAAERTAEAGWIAQTIEEYGGRAPLQLVEQILALHRRYLQGGPGVPLPDAPADAAFAGAEAAAEEAEAEADGKAEAAEAGADQAAERSPADESPADGEVTPASKDGRIARRTRTRRPIAEGAREGEG